MPENQMKHANYDLMLSDVLGSDLKLEPNVETDHTYENLLGSEEWGKLKPEIKQRFSIKPAKGKKIVYVGTMSVKHSLMGWLFAQFCRMIGRPLVTRKGDNIPVVVNLTRNSELGGTNWERNYSFLASQETVISTKALSVNGQLEEHIGFGFSMCLDLKVLDGNLEFHSSAYRWRLAKYCFTLPALITPGKIVVKHEQVENEFFRFTLDVKHPLLGQTFFQTGIFS